MHTEERTHEARDGFPLHVWRWTPEGEARGVIQVLHGLAEHAARYARVAEALTAAGWIVVAHDHRGHGRSVRDELDRGHFADQDGWTVALDDIDELAAWIRSEHPGLPFVRFGHSMGSSLALLSSTRHPEGLAALVLSGPVGKVNGLLRRGGLLVAKLERLRLGHRGRSKLLHALSFGDFNKAFEPARTEYDWLSRDAAEVDAYASDPLCGFVVTTQHWHDHLIALGKLCDAGELGGLPSDLPILVFAGSEDPVGGATKQLVPWLEALRRAGVTDLSHTFYEGGRHEMLNEINRDEVTADLLAWLDAHGKGA